MMDELTSKDYYFDSYSHFGKSLGVLMSDHNVHRNSRGDVEG